MEHGTIFLDVLTVSDRLRHLDAAKVGNIAASMAELGLQQPISIWASEDGAVVELVAGAHRVEAAKKLGWEKVDCIFVGLDDLDRQLWQIDENLMRAELSSLERAKHTAQRADVVRQKSELAKLSKTDSGQSQNAPRGQGEFEEGHREIHQDRAPRQGSRRKDRR